MKSRRSWWGLFGAGAVLIIAALCWVTVVVLRLEHAETAARAETRFQESVRLALWRMDSWLSPQIAREAARPYFEYLPYYPQARAYTRFLSEIDTGEVMTPSSLLTFHSDSILIHFQIASDGTLTSPQVPTGNLRDLAEGTCVTPEAVNERTAVLQRVRGLLDMKRIVACIAADENKLVSLGDTPAAYGAGPGGAQNLSKNAQVEQQQLTQMEYLQRALSSKMAQSAQTFQAPAGTATKGGVPTEGGGAADAPAQQPEQEQVDVGPLLPLWLPDQGATPAMPPALVFVRQVHAGNSACVQGFLIDWPRLRTAMLGQITDLMTDSSLTPLVQPFDPSAPTGMVLASIPAELGGRSQAAGSTNPLITPARLTLSLSWLAVAAAIAAAGIALSASIAFGQKRSRFASAVTHELRTPLTTFRMYSEMLADGMVPGEQQRHAYLQTLKRESGRLATLVENVLSYARLEERRSDTRAQRTTLTEMLDRHMPSLLRRCDEAGMELCLSTNGHEDASLTVDADAIGQILFNLVDNASKYAAEATDRRVHLDAHLRDGLLELMVSDHGPGVAPEHVKAIFSPFERGAHGPGDTIPGVGLGLALARGLAKDLGGRLELDRSSSGGATFRLTVPAMRGT